MNRSFRALVLLGSVGCAGTVAPPKPAEEKLPASMSEESLCDYRGRSGREVRETASLGNVRPNIRRVYATLGEGEHKRRLLLCREVDTNLDGKTDVARTFNHKGESLRELVDSDYDGRIDTWLTFARGQVIRVERDSDGDGNPDEFRQQVRGKLARLQRDTNRDGRIDVWEVYDRGQLQRIGHDLDGDGRVDRWDRDAVVERAALLQETPTATPQVGAPATPQVGAPATPQVGAPATPQVGAPVTKAPESAVQNQPVPELGR